MCICCSSFKPKTDSNKLTKRNFEIRVPRRGTFPMVSPWIDAYAPC